MEKHGLSRTPMHNAWKTMIARCHKTTNSRYHLYGARGITVCDRWRYSFVNFLADMGERPTKKHSIDRIDNNLGYSPENCRWATQSEQLRNYSRTVKYSYNGKEYCHADMADILGIGNQSLRDRVKYFGSKELAIEMSLKSNKRRILPIGWKTKCQ